MEKDDIQRITRNYSIPLGKGGFGEVYKGFLDEDHDLVAVKRYIRGNLREEFLEEVSIHSKIKHKNVVTLIGYCIGESSLSMVTEYISKGNLDDTLHRSNVSIPLDMMRLGIAIGCAEALCYMHSKHLSSDSLVCHGDIKPANILLDYGLRAKVSDFGLSRLLSGGITRYTSNVKGSIDYMDPIYLREGRLTPRSDVYSFGAVLLELIARRRIKEGNVSLIGTFCKACDKGKGFRELFDVEIANESNVKILEEIARLAVECLRLDIDKRPRMDYVAKHLLVFWRALRGGQGIGWHKKSFGIFKRHAASGNPDEILIDRSHIRILTKVELNQVTRNYSYRLGGSGGVYKGTLEDNTVVVVKKFSGSNELSKDEFINEGLILSKISHKNIIELMGCCMEADTPIFLYEYATRGSLYDILDGHEDFPVDIRVKIAVETAEALEYLHSSLTGITIHASVTPYNLLLDDNFMPKLTGFSQAVRLLRFNELIPQSYPCALGPQLTDIYMFGVLLLALISRKNYVYYVDPDHLVIKFHAAYRKDHSGKAFLDKDITAEEDITVLEEIGRLALRCTDLDEEGRPTMKEVAEHLRKLRRRWKKTASREQN
ncbi:unnamed protein product [Urochloa decumbens]|uniref:Protein kinase domain-containing protein n=1 Tax=Urochloa decumbens TaxID=240449 RepID=A0ABC9AYB3_9POAL